MGPDLYTVWLGIPPGPRPPDHYTLLGLPRPCHDAKRIEQAAYAQLDKLDKFALNPDTQKRQACQDIMNEVAKARMVLADAKSRRAYDQAHGFDETQDQGTSSPALEAALQQIQPVETKGLTRPPVRGPRVVREAPVPAGGRRAPVTAVVALVLVIIAAAAATLYFRSGSAASPSNNLGMRDQAPIVNPPSTRALLPARPDTPTLPTGPSATIPPPTTPRVANATTAVPPVSPARPPAAVSPTVAGHDATAPPPTRPSPPIAVRASRSLSGAAPANVLRLDPGQGWGSGASAPAWIEFDLGEPRLFQSMDLDVIQLPPGHTTHEVWVSSQPIGDSRAAARLVHTFDGQTRHAQILTAEFPKPLPARYVQVRTTVSPSWVAWNRVRINSAPATAPGTDSGSGVASADGPATVSPPTEAPGDIPPPGRVSARASDTWANHAPAAVLADNTTHGWNAGHAAPAWIEIDLGDQRMFKGILLGVSQSDPGRTTHEIWVSDRPIGDVRTAAKLVHTFDGDTKEGVTIGATLVSPVPARFVQVHTTRSGGWVDWNRIRVRSSPIRHPQPTTEAGGDASTAAAPSADDLPSDVPNASDARWVVLFRSANPKLWNTSDNSQPTKDFAVPIDQAPKNMRYLRMRRMDTGSAVIIELPYRELGNMVREQHWGWRGDNLNSRRMYHLGIMTGPIPNEDARTFVYIHGERRLSRSGWGFGDNNHLNRQGYCWNGQPIQPTVMEIAVTSEDLTSQEQLKVLRADGKIGTPGAPTAQAADDAPVDDAAADGESLLLTTIKPDSAHLGWGDYMVNECFADKKLKPMLGKETVNEFVWAHAPSQITYTIPAGYTRFTAFGATMHDKVLAFEVKLDGKPAFQSKALTEYPNNFVRVSVDLPVGTKTITLIADDKGNSHGKWAVWCKPRLVK